MDGYPTGGASLPQNGFKIWLNISTETQTQTLRLVEQVKLRLPHKNNHKARKLPTFSFPTL